MWGINNDERVNEILKKFLRGYVENEKSDNKKSLDIWLFDSLKEELPEKNDDEISQIVFELTEGINDNSKRITEVERQSKFGIKPVHYLAGEIIESIELVDEDIGKTKDAMREFSRQLEEYNEEEIYRAAAIEEPELVGSILGINKTQGYIDNINKVIEEGNQKLLNKVFNKDGSINQNSNLDGFIFEHDHANTFNINAAVQDNTRFRAEVLEPKIGETYGKNSVDIVIKDIKTGKIVKKYQAKAYKNAQETAKAFNSGNYKGQGKLVPEGQEVRGAADKIEYGDIESNPSSKEMMKEQQSEAQKGDIEKVKKSFKNDVDTLKLAKQIGKQMLQAGVLSMGMGIVFSAGEKILSGEEIEAEEIIINGLKAGSVGGISTAVAGGLKVAVEKKAITGVMAKILSKNNIIGTVAASTVGIVSTLFEVGKGDITLGEGVKKIGVTLSASYAGIIGFANGNFLGVAVAGAVLPAIGVAGTVGAVITAAVGFTAGCIGAIAGSQVAGAIGRGAMEVGNYVVRGAVGIVKGGVAVVKTVASGVITGVKAVGSAIISGVGSVCSGIASFF